MLKKSEIDEIIKIAIKKILDNSENFNLESFFIGPESIIESIDIVQIIAFVEDKLDEKGFEGLVRLICEQQLSVASAKAIFDRLAKIVSPFEAKNFLKVSKKLLLIIKNIILQISAKLRI